MSLTRQEVFQALADGKEVECKSIHAAHVCAYNSIAYSALEPNKFGNYYWRIKPEPLKWYEKIPEHGVLCWYGSKCHELPVKSRCLTIIINYDPRITAKDVIITEYESGLQIECFLTYLPYNISEKLKLQFDQSSRLLMQ